MLTEFLKLYNGNATLVIKRKSSSEIIEQVRHNELDAALLPLIANIKSN